MYHISTLGPSDFERSRHFRWLWLPFKTETHLLKGYFHVLSHSFLIWLQSFNKLLIKPTQKIASKKFDIIMKKMHTFMLSSNMKNEHQTTSHKKLQAKSRFMSYYSHKLFSMVYNFFWRSFLQFSQRFCTPYEIPHA